MMFERLISTGTTDPRVSLLRRANRRHWPIGDNGRNRPTRRVD